MPDSVLGENYSHKISAEFDSESAANDAVASLLHAGIPSSQTEIIRPDDPDMAIKVEPEAQGVGRSLAKTHVVLGLAGLVVGLILAALLVTVGPTLTQSSPVMTFIAVGFICPVLALLLAGAISIRPDHDPLIEKTRMANKAGRWTVVAHCSSLEQQKEAKAAMGSDIQTF